MRFPYGLKAVEVLDASGSKLYVVGLLKFPSLRGLYIYRCCSQQQREPSIFNVPRGTQTKNKKCHEKGP